jgi:hypothetical protein
LEEVDRQQHEAQVVFTQMEWMGLQQELYGSRFTASPVRGRSEQSTPSLSFQPSHSPLSLQSSQFHSCEETIRLSWVWRSTRFPFVITSLTFGNNWESHSCQRWRRWYRQSTQLPKLSWGAINIHYPYATTSSLSRLYQLTPLSLQLSSIYLRPLPYVRPSSSHIWLSELLKPVTSILVGDNVMNFSFLFFFFFNMHLPYDFHFTYPDMSLPAGVHESPNTYTTCVCLTVNTLFPTV